MVVPNTNTWTAKDSYGNISSVYTQVITLDKTYNDQPIIDQGKRLLRIQK